MMGRDLLLSLFTDDKMSKWLEAWRWSGQDSAHTLPALLPASARPGRLLGMGSRKEAEVRESAVFQQNLVQASRLCGVWWGVGRFLSTLW